jgi:MFS family permease
MRSRVLPSGVPARRRALPPWLALAGTALGFTSLYLAAGVLTPLLVDYKARFGFAPEMLNVAFAVYAAGFLVAVLVVGSLSDYIGRRPVLIGGLLVQLTSNLVFLFATDVGDVITGRVIQGVASGAATAAFTATLVEFAPDSNKRLGAVLASVTLTGGLALGSLAGGLAIELTRFANTIIFVSLIAMTLLGAAVTILSRETGGRAPGAMRSLIPRVSVPTHARAEFLAAAPVVAAVWMLAGLSGGLAPSMVRSVFGIDNALLGGFAGFVAPAVSSGIGFAFARMSPRKAIVIGIYAAIIGSLAIIGGVFMGSLIIMIAGQAVAGVAFGASFTAALQLLIPLVRPQQRAGIVSAVYVVSYAAFGLPIVVEGQLVRPLGEVPAVVAYTGLTLALAVISLIAQARLKRHG